MEYWRFAEEGRIRWWWLAGALAGWGLSTWLLIKTLEALARHSPSLKFVGWFTFAGVALIIASFVFAASRADIVCDEIRTWNNEPRWFPIVWAVPALVVALVALVTHLKGSFAAGSVGRSNAHPDHDRRIGRSHAGWHIQGSQTRQQVKKRTNDPYLQGGRSGKENAEL